MPASHDRTQNSWDHDLSPPVSGQVSDSGGRRSAPSTSLSSGVDGPENHGSYPSSRLPIFIDKVANALDLSPRYRGELHAFKELALELSPGLQRAIIYQQGSIYKTLQNAEDLRADITTMKQELKDIGEQLSKRFVVSEDQHDDILALAKAMVIEPGRDDFNFADEQVQRLKDAAQFPRFKDIFKSKANTKTVTQVVRRQASYARNAYRQFLRNSVFDGRKKCGLTACARQASRKFNNGEDVTPEMVLQIAILRRFIRDNRELVASDAVSDPWDSDDETQDGDGDGTGTRKRKRARSAVHFWGAVTDFFKAKNDIWGKGLRTNGWATFIDECLEQERELFPDDNLRDIPQRAGATMSNNAPSNGAGYRLPDWASDGMASTSTESAPFASTASGSLSTEEMSRGYSPSPVPSPSPMASPPPASAPTSTSNAHRHARRARPGTSSPRPGSASENRPRPRPVRPQTVRDVTPTSQHAAGVSDPHIRPPSSTSFHPQLPRISEFLHTVPNGIPAHVGSFGTVPALPPALHPSQAIPGLSSSALSFATPHDHHVNGLPPMGFTQ